MKDRIFTGNFVLLTVSSALFYTVMFALTPTLTLYAQSIGAGTSAGGLIVLVCTLGQLLPRVVFGSLADRWGRKPVYLLGIVLIAVASPVFGLWATFAGLLVLRGIQGIGFSAATTGGSTMAADLVPASRRSEGIGYYSLSNTLGMALGPGLGLFLLDTYGAAGLFWGCLAAGLAGSAVGTLINYEKSPPVRQEKKLILVEPTVLKVCLVLFFLALPYGGILGYIASYGKDRGIQEIGLFFTVVAAAVLAVRLLSGKWSDKHGASLVLVPALGLMAAAMVVLFRADSLMLFLVSAALFGLGYGAVYPLMQSLAIQLCPAERRGAASATLLATLDIAIGLGALVTGLAIEQGGYPLAFGGLALFVALGLVCFLAVLAPTIPRNLSKKDR